MSDASTPRMQGSVQGRGGSLRLYEAAAAQVGDDTNGSAIIRRIMALSQAAADGHAAEVREREEADRDRSQGDVVADASTGSDDGGTVLAGVGAQSGVDNAPTDGQRGQAVRPLLIPAETYPPAGSTGSPIDVNGDEYYTPDVISTHQSPTSFPGSSSTAYDLNFFESRSPISTRAHSCNIPDGPIAHDRLRFAIPSATRHPLSAIPMAPPCDTVKYGDYNVETD